jgi:hypothetical protein
MSILDKETHQLRQMNLLSKQRLISMPKNTVLVTLAHFQFLVLTIAIMVLENLVYLAVQNKLIWLEFKQKTGLLLLSLNLNTLSLNMSMRMKQRRRNVCKG